MQNKTKIETLFMSSSDHMIPIKFIETINDYLRYMLHLIHNLDKNVARFKVI